MKGSAATPDENEALNSMAMNNSYHHTTKRAAAEANVINSYCRVPVSQHSFFFQTQLRLKMQKKENLLMSGTMPNFNIQDIAQKARGVSQKVQ